MEVNSTGQFLPYDKDRARGERKPDQILSDSITEGPGCVLVPVLNQRGHGRAEVFCYGNLGSGTVPGLDTAAKLAADHGVASAKLKWFSPQRDERADHMVRLQLKEFAPAGEPKPSAPEPLPLAQLPDGERVTFEAFAEAQGKDSRSSLNSSTTASNTARS